MGCMHPSLSPLGEEGRRYCRAKHCHGSGKTSAGEGQRPDGAPDSGRSSGDEDGAVTVALLVNAFAAGLLSGEATQKLHAEYGTAVDLRQCSVPSYRVLTLSGLPAAVHQSVVSALGEAPDPPFFRSPVSHTISTLFDKRCVNLKLKSSLLCLGLDWNAATVLVLTRNVCLCADTLKAHPEATEALKLGQIDADPVHAPPSRQIPERSNERLMAYPARQPPPPAQPRATFHSPGSLPPTRYRLLVPLQLVNPLLGPTGGIAECVKAHDGAIITFSSSGIGEHSTAPSQRICAA